MRMARTFFSTSCTRTKLQPFVTASTVVARVPSSLSETGKSNVTHDLGVIASMCSRILVMYGGTICEQGDAREIFYDPRHPYTWGLLNSIPKADGSDEKLIPIKGTPPDMLKPPAGCPFSPRCRYCMPVCRSYAPPMTRLSDTHSVACHLMHPKAPKITREV